MYFFIGQDIVDDGGRPALYTLCGGNTVLLQLPLDLSQGAAVSDTYGKCGG